MRKIKLRKINVGDASTIKATAKESATLDEQNLYTYWVMCKYQSDCSFILTVNDIFAGYILCVKNKHTVFIWQICILKEFRGNKFAQILIDQVFKIAKENCCDVQFTMLKNNDICRQAFSNACQRHNCNMKQIGIVDLIGTENELIYKIDFS